MSASTGGGGVRGRRRGSGVREMVEEFAGRDRGIFRQGNAAGRQERGGGSWSVREADVGTARAV